MRSVPADSFARLSAPDALWAAWRRVRRGKGRSPAVAEFAIEADRHVFALHRALRAGTYRPGAYRLSIVRDPKTRLIAAAPVVDRVVHQALVAALRPTFERRFVHQSYASRLGKGPHRACLAHLSLMRRARFRLALDVAQYFASIDHRVVRNLIEHRERDPDTRALVAATIARGGDVYRTPLARRVLGLDAAPQPPGVGLPIGSYFSQWAALLYLDGLDHYVLRVSKPVGYQRYCDDMALFDNDPDRLRAIRDDVARWLADERRLTLKRPDQQPAATTVPCTWLGYRVSRAGFSPGRKMRRRVVRNVRRAAAKGNDALERTLASYRGLFAF